MPQPRANETSEPGALPAIYTIGHSNRSLDAFVALLAGFGIETVVDVRTVPRSRTNPQFNTDTLPASLAPHRIEYVHVKELGGLRSAQKSVAPAINGAWDNASFHNYADHALGDPFRAALASLIERSRRERCVVMCAEAVWWRCHRRIITDHLLARGVPVIHVLGVGKSEPAVLTPFARTDASGRVTYPSLV
jgi:uncharacterized protein (DUF488 family)